jgi:glycosyltransferase involved in cell wall biosynthesis
MRATREASATGKIRVMASIGSLGTGGSEKQLTEMLVRLPRHRFDPVLVTITETDRSRSHRNRLEHAGIPVRSLGVPTGAMPSRWLQLTSRYWRAMKETDPDIVYVWLDEAAAYVAPLCRLQRIPCLVARRNTIGSMTERRNGALGWGIRQMERSATLVTANSEAVKQSSIDRGHRADRIRLVPNGHEPTPPVPVPPSPPTVFGYVAQFRPEKGHARLIEALTRMPPGDWRVDLAGDGELRPSVEAQVQATGLAGRVRFVGEISDARAFWSERHVAMLVSDSEGLPNALLEAAFAGRAAIGTRTGGIPEVVGPGGILVPLDDREAIGRAMQYMIEHPRERARMGDAIWTHVAARYSMDRMLAAHLVAIEEAWRGGSTWTSNDGGA